MKQVLEDEGTEVALAAFQMSGGEKHIQRDACVSEGVDKLRAERQAGSRWAEKMWATPLG